MNKLLQRQLQEHFGKPNGVPEYIVPFCKVISDAYDHFEKGTKKTMNLVDPFSKGMNELNGVLHKEEDPIEKKRSKKLFAIEKKRFDDLFTQAPFSMGVLKGPNHVFEMANPLYLQLIGKDDIIGKSVKNVMPEIASQGFIELLDRVYKTGTTFSANEMLIQLDKKGNGKLADTYLNFVYQVYNNNDGNIEGIFFFAIDVTEQVLSRKKIEESEHRYRQIVETAQEGIWMIDEENKTNFVNNKICEILEYTPQEMMGKDIYFFMDDEGKRIAAELMQKKKEGHSGQDDFKYISRTGKEVWTNISTNPLYNEDGSYKGALAMVTDISERKKGENKLKESELRYRSLIEQANDAICIADIYMNIIDINPSGCLMLGYSKQEILRLTVADLFLPEELKANPLMIDELIAGKTISNERRFKRKDGTIVEVELNGKLLDDGRFILFGRDISERKHVEKLLKESELRYRSLIEQATDAICIADNTLQFIEMNPYACEFLGYTKEEALQLLVTDVLFPEDLATNPIDKFATIKPNEIIRNERRFKRKDGSAVVMEVSSRLEDGRFIMFGHDVSERKKAEEAIRRSEASLDRINQELGLKNKELEQFAYVASHDMQEPLRTTSSFVELLQLQYRGRLDENADKYLSFIAESSERMKVLIKDLLDYSRIGRKKELAEVDCNAMVSEVLADLGTAINETGAKIKMEQLPVVSGYATEIKQLFQNLIINAIKFRNKDISPQINISVQKTKGYWQFACADNGIGIQKEHNERIFIIFQRLHTRNEYEGSGIGLSHCKKIAELHKGRIWLESELGRGSTFYFTIPQKNNN